MSTMPEHQVRFDDGAAYERMMGVYQRILIALAISLVALAGCARDPLDTGNADMDYRHAQSWQAAQAMRGKEYVFVMPAKVCSDKNDAVLGPHSNFPSLPHAPDCLAVSAGRFRVVDAVLMRNGSTLLQISGENIAGYIPYEIFLPQPYKPAREYFPTGR